MITDEQLERRLVATFQAVAHTVCDDMVDNADVARAPTAFVPTSSIRSKRPRIGRALVGVAAAVAIAALGLTLAVRRNAATDEPAPGLPDIHVTDQSVYTNTPEGATGPGSVTVTGTATAEVTSISLELADGTTHPADLNNGVFTVRADIPAGVDAFDERLHWVLTNGASRSARVDLLDAATSEESCATTPGCVERRLTDLLHNAVTQHHTAQAAILADGTITDTEWTTTLQRYVDCLNAAGLHAYRIGHTISVDASPVDNSQHDQGQIESTCGADAWSEVNEAHSLLDAQRRVQQPGTPAPTRSR